MRPALWILFLALVLAQGWVRLSAADPHDKYGAPQLNRWFGDLHSASGVLCCSGHDGEVIEDADWESKDGHYRVRIGGNWIDVPPTAVVKGPNLYGRTMVWPYPTRMGVRCFMPGTMSFLFNPQWWPLA